MNTNEALKEIKAATAENRPANLTGTNLTNADLTNADLMGAIGYDR